jgi:2-polyprenyl-3-methyl-5-hydroxy-6-metoxy-1,4-benzoquinol methylase
VSTELHACIVCGGTLRRARVKDGFELVACTRCGMLMRRSLPALDELPAIYAPEYYEDRLEQPVRGYADYLGDADRHRETARRRLRLLDRFARARGKLLDVGAAAGFFVDEAQRAGWEAEGVDVADHMVEWGRRELGASLRTGVLADVEAKGSFAAVTMWDYIEHALDPRDDLTRAHDLLGPGGVIALSTGDVDSLVARASGSSWHLLTPRHHNFFFSVKTLTLLLVATGFEAVWSGHPGARYSLAHISHKSLPARVAGRVARSRFARYGLPLNLFDIVTVIARKS